MVKIEEDIVEEGEEELYSRRRGDESQVVGLILN